MTVPGLCETEKFLGCVPQKAVLLLRRQPVREGTLLAPALVTSNLDREPQQPIVRTIDLDEQLLDERLHVIPLVRRVRRVSLVVIPRWRER